MEVREEGWKVREEGWRVREEGWRVREEGVIGEVGKRIAQLVRLWGRGEGLTSARTERAEMASSMKASARKEDTPPLSHHHHHTVTPSNCHCLTLSHYHHHTVTPSHHHPHTVTPSPSLLHSHTTLLVSIECEGGGVRGEGGGRRGCTCTSVECRLLKRRQLHTDILIGQQGRGEGGGGGGRG